MRRLKLLDILECKDVDPKTKIGLIATITVTKECEDAYVLYADKKGNLFYDMGSEKWFMNICIPELATKGATHEN
jgi:hypothetical protein